MDILKNIKQAKGVEKDGGGYIQVGVRECPALYQMIYQH